MWAREDGAVVVEFGVMFPVLALLVAGIVSFGLAYSTQLNLQQAAREAVRAYALGSGDPVVVAQQASPNTALAAGAVQTSGDCPDPSSPANPAPASWVEVTHTFTLPVPFVPFDELDLRARAVMRCGG